MAKSRKPAARSARNSVIREKVPKANAYGSTVSTITNGKLGTARRIEALRALGWDICSDAGTLAAVLNILMDTTEAPELRLAVLASLQSATFDATLYPGFRPDYIAALRWVAQDENGELRQTALGILAREKDGPTQEQLIAGLKDPEVALLKPEKALQLLSYDIHGDVYQLAREIAAKPPSAIARREALRLLAADTASAPLFETLLKDKAESTEIRQLAAAALNGLAPARLQVCARDIALDESEGPDIKAVGLTALAQFGAGNVRDTVLDEFVNGLGSPANLPASLQYAVRQFVSKRKL